MTSKNYVLAGAAALVVGLFLPVFSMSMLGSVNLFGNGGNLAGLVLLLCAALAGGLVLNGRSQDVIWPAAAACGVLLYVFIRLQWIMGQMRDSLRELEGNPFAGLAENAMGSAQLQWGWLVLIAGAGAMAYGAWQMRDRTRPLREFDDRLGKGVAALSIVALLALPASDFFDSVRTADADRVEASETDVVGAASDAAAAVGQPSEEAAYIEQFLEVYDLQAKYHDTYIDGRIPGVTFKVRNKGDRTLNRVAVRVVFLDATGQPIAEEEYTPVLVSDYSFGDNNTPLRPNYISQLERGKFWSAKSVPSEWETGRVTATVTEIEFAPDEGASSAE